MIIRQKEGNRPETRTTTAVTPSVSWKVQYTDVYTRAIEIPQRAHIFKANCCLKVHYAPGGAEIDVFLKLHETPLDLLLEFLQFFTSIIKFSK